VSACRSCGAEITWTITVAGKRMPLDNRPTQDGTVVIDPDGRARVPAKADLQFARLRFTPHWATCPHADTHRRTRHAR
jgi:hypothetical protein